jgi:hypothetical protein
MTNAGVQQELQEYAMSKDYAWAQDISNSRIDILLVKIVLAIYQGPVDPTTRVSFLFAVSTCVCPALCANTHVKLLAHFRVFVLLCKALKVTPLVEPSANHVASREVDLSLSSGSDCCKKKNFSHRHGRVLGK